MSSSPSQAAIARFAPAAFILIWATGYVVAKAAAPHAEPLTFLLVRYAGVVAMMLAAGLVVPLRWPGPRQALHLAIAGIAMQAVYLGGVWVAIAQGMPAGLAALIVNLQPVLTAALAPAIGERLGRGQWAGIALGFAGVVVVVWEKLQLADGLLAGPTALCVLALVGMTLGTLYQKHHVTPFDLRAGQIVQSVAAFAATAPFALAFESLRFDWTPAAAAALAWSVFVLTGVGGTLIFLMLRFGRATTMTSYMYLVPAVTALLAWALFGETLSLRAVAGMAITLAGVWLVVR